MRGPNGWMSTATILAVTLTGPANAWYDGNKCCALAKQDNSFTNINNASAICGQSYSENLDGVPIAPAPAAIVSWHFCSTSCPGWGRSIFDRSSQWAAPLIQFVLPSAIFVMTVPKSTEINPDNSAISKAVGGTLKKVLGGTGWLRWLRSAIHFFVITLFVDFILIFADTLAWILIIFTLAGPMLVDGLLEAILDYRILSHVEQLQSDQVAHPETVELLLTIVAGNLELQDSYPCRDILEALSQPPAQQDGQPNRKAREESMKGRLLAMLTTQTAYGGAVGAPVLFYLGSFFYNIIDLDSNPSSEDSAIGLAFGLEWMVIVHVAMFSGCLLASNNPSTACAIVGVPPPTPKAGQSHSEDCKTPASVQHDYHPHAEGALPIPVWLRRVWHTASVPLYELVGVSPVYETAFQPVPMRLRGRNKLKWLTQTEAWQQSPEFRHDIAMFKWPWLFPATVLLILFPSITGAIVAYATPPRGFSCRCLSFITYSGFQFCLIVHAIWHIHVESPGLWRWLQAVQRRPLQGLHALWNVAAIVIQPVGWLIYTVLLIGSLFTGVGGTLMQLLGVYRTCFCYILTRFWTHPNRSPGVDVASDTQGQRSSSRNWLIAGWTAVIFMSVVCYAGWEYQKSLRLRFTGQVEKLKLAPDETGAGTSPPLATHAGLTTTAHQLQQSPTHPAPTRDYIPHTIQPVSGYADLTKAGGDIVRPMKRPGRGGIVVFDDGDIADELTAERDAFCALADMPEVDDESDDNDDDDDDDDGGDEEAEAGDDSDRDDDASNSKKRKSWPDREQGDGASDGDDEPPRQRRRSNSGSSIASSERDRTPPSSQPTSSPRPRRRKEPTAKQLRRKLVSLRRSHERVLQQYYSLGTSYSEPVSSLAYSLASDLGREDNDLLWLAIIGVTSLELNGQTYTGLGTTQPAVPDGPHMYHRSWKATRSSRTYALLRDEVRRLNPLPPTVSPSGSPLYSAATSHRESTIRLSPDPRFVLLRHWSLYDSMLYSPYVAARLHVWNESGQKRLHKLLAKMGVSLTQCKQTYTHMDIGLKKSVREQLLKYAGVYGLDGVIPVGSGRASYEQEGWSFVRTWGWKAQLNATDVGVVLGAILDMGSPSSMPIKATHMGSTQQTETDEVPDRSEALIPRFFAAYDALAPNQPLRLLEAIPKAQDLVRAIHRTGSSLLVKHQIRHLRAFRMGVVKDGPDLSLFANSPGALVKLALWVGEAVGVHERDKKGVNEATPLVLAALDEHRGTYVVVGTGAFQEVVEETNARVKIDSFDHCVVEVKKEDLGGFLEALSLKSVQHDELSAFASYIKQYPGFVDTLNSGVFTVLAPTNDALSTFAQQYPQQANDSSQMFHLLQYHIIQDSHTSDTFGIGSSFPATLLTNVSYTNVTGGQVVELTTVNGSPAIVSGLKTVSLIATPDIVFVGGVIHSISNILTVPVSFPATAMVAGLEYLVALLSKGRWLNPHDPALTAVETLSDLTVFAPNSPEFGASYTGWNGLNESDLWSIFEYSIVQKHPVAYSTSTVLSNNAKLPTLLWPSEKLSVTITQLGTDLYVDAAKIIARDYICSNGVMQVIDQPLNPNSTNSRPSVVLDTSTSTPSSTAHSSFSTATAAGIGITIGALVFGIVIATAVVSFPS
ncbi:hypothetical protein DV737_g4463, partial [Chaetothyriales sp. CBS 132003]